jgi:hypothetical protein
MSRLTVIFAFKNIQLYFQVISAATAIVQVS